MIIGEGYVKVSYGLSGVTTVGDFPYKTHVPSIAYQVLSASGLQSIEENRHNRIATSNNLRFASRDTLFSMKNFIFGYGSLICPQSRAITAPTLSNAIAEPVVVNHIERTWSARVTEGEHILD